MLFKIEVFCMIPMMDRVRTTLLGLHGTYFTLPAMADIVIYCLAPLLDLRPSGYSIADVARRNLYTDTVPDDLEIVAVNDTGQYLVCDTVCTRKTGADFRVRTDGGDEIPYPLALPPHCNLVLYPDMVCWYDRKNMYRYLAYSVSGAEPTLRPAGPADTLNPRGGFRAGEELWGWGYLNSDRGYVMAVSDCREKMSIYLLDITADSTVLQLLVIDRKCVHRRTCMCI